MMHGLKIPNNFVKSGTNGKGSSDWNKDINDVSINN